MIVTGCHDSQEYEYIFQKYRTFPIDRHVIENVSFKRINGNSSKGFSINESSLDVLFFFFFFSFRFASFRLILLDFYTLFVTIRNWSVKRTHTLNTI